MKILIVDDEPTIRSILKNIVEMRGHEAVEAGDGDDGFKKAALHKPDLIISDGLMPDTDGFHFLRNIRADKTLHSTPFIFYSGVYTGEDERKFAFSLGANGFIVKPKSVNDFWSEVEGVLRDLKPEPAVLKKDRDSLLEEEDYLKKYTAIVANKLEQKTKELEKSIEERSEIEDELRKKEEFYRTIIKDIPDLICRYLPDGTITYVNDLYCRYFGKTKEELIGHTFMPLIHEEDREMFEDYIKTIGRQNPVGDIEHRVVAPDGGIRWHHWRDRAIFDEDGNIKEFQGTGRDITDLKTALETIRENEEKFRAISASAQDAIILMDNDENILYWNESAERIFGYGSDEVMGKHLHILLVPEEYHQAYNGGFQKFKDTGEGPAIGKILELTAKKKDGTVFSVELSIASVKIKNRWHAIGILRDITERKKTEEQLKDYTENLEYAVARRTSEANEAMNQAVAANKAKSDFLAGMSHELRTPLNSIIGFSETLQDELFGSLNEKQKEYVEYILGSGRHLLSLINDILDLSKVEAGKVELEMSRFRLRELLEASMLLLKEKAFKHRINMTLEIGGDADIEIEADERRLKQIMFNLLSNAVKFTEDGGSVIVSVRLRDGDSIEISVSDTGIGIKPEDMGKLFKEFSQVESVYSKSKEGTGLGLALTKKLVELHGGRVWAESEFGKGSRFSFSIPLR
jgi:PAS domain S-box-containing protein